MTHRIEGTLTTLRPATMNDKRAIYQWMAESDLTSLMIGPPNFPDHPIPTWEEFLDDYEDYFFDGSKPLLGHSFIIELNEQPIGQINYGEIYPDDQVTELDIWLSARKYIGKGYGTDALITLCSYLHQKFHVKKFMIAPSERNIGAIKAYKKAGFMPTTDRPVYFRPDYDDAILMIKQWSS
ncbi:GNAT family N-acetyltransferase [Fulvivirgaceae bacterium BMA10]|uniref:GNAT family N-acetyltransferase n=1 Tax=Splendidivirga corallicola TaxID=3051826 RepID=A0ABT8KHY3_9BACT|nr:GNAT family N-acetyltransferase [Fulvivirgaceae bacterium BMA10]